MKGNLRQWAAMLLLGLLIVMSAGTAPMPPANRIDDAPGVMRFAWFDIFVDSGKTPLAAYQLEITLPASAKIVGLEGSDPGPFQEAPYYDPAAREGNRVIVAAFSTADAKVLPAGKTRVARLHVVLTDALENVMPKTTDKLTVATDSQGQTIAATLSLQPHTTQGEKP